MMSIRYCKRCNVIYKYGNDKICSNCLVEIDEIMVKIKSYLDEHPLAGISEISENINETEKDILYLLREGRLSIKSENKKLLCSRCGISIDSGRYCDKCIDKIKIELNNAANEFKNNEKGTVDNNRAISSSSKAESKIHTLYKRKNHFK